MHRTRYHFLEETTSTNDEARNPRYGHGDAICAERQTAGRGQRGHTWSSEEGRNLMFSLVWEPRFLPVSEQFLLSEAVALALTDLFGGYGIDARIKWTNDIYAGDRKLVGILIEHNLTGDRLSRTIVGIGVNVNQTRFDPSLPNPSSMCLETGCEYDRQALQADYRRRMYRLGERHRYRYPDGRTVEAVLRGVRPSGELLLELPDGRTEGYLFREIEFVIEGKRTARTDGTGCVLKK